MIVYQLGPRKPSERVLVASALIFIAVGCSTTPNEVVDMNYTTGCWELFVEHERRIGGNY